ncbi:hypothetical protein T492DRAFT_113649 [Pavlovales sp. CCMP2436]|nr:hypothetical protein T492DRAFT_113649 [Pavlovales sp. CCMP2436]
MPLCMTRVLMTSVPAILGERFSVVMACDDCLRGELKYQERQPLRAALRSDLAPRGGARGGVPGQGSRRAHDLPRRGVPDRPVAQECTAGLARTV